MPFETVGERVPAVAPRKDATIQLKVRANATHPTCLISIRKPLAERLDLKDGMPVELQIGTGEDYGKARIAFGEDAKAKTTKVVTNRMGGARLDFGFVKQLPDVSKAKVEIDAKILFMRMVELALPDWEKVDAGRPRVRQAKEEPPPEREAPPPERKRPELTPRRAPPPPPAPPAHVNGVIPGTTTAARKADIPISREGVTITFDPPELRYEGQSLALDDRQARFLGVLVRAIGGIMTTGDILHKMDSHETPGIIHDVCFRKLVSPLEAIGLRLGHQRNFGYQLSRNR